MQVNNPMYSGEYPMPGRQINTEFNSATNQHYLTQPILRNSVTEEGVSLILVLKLTLKLSWNRNN